LKEFNPEGVIFSTALNRERLSSISALQNAYINSIVLEGVATRFDLNKNMVVDLGVINGIIPFYASALGIENGRTKEISLLTKIGKPINFIITDFSNDENGNPIAVLSRSMVQQICHERYISNLRSGDIIEGLITRIEPFGCFVDIGCGITALLPLENISVSRITHPSDRFNCGQEIKCVIKHIDPNGNITLSHKELLGNWNENAALFRTGETVVGTVRSIENYGVFIELMPNLTGLADSFSGAKRGQRASVYIKNIIPDKMKIKLIIIDTFEAVDNTKRVDYFIESGHIDKIKYSPEMCRRVIETDFSN